jgi:hypothetical protein
MPIRAKHGAMLAHSNAIDLRSTRTYASLKGDLPWRDIIARPEGTVVNRGRSPVRLIVFLRPGVVGRKIHHHGQTIHVNGSIVTAGCSLDRIDGLKMDTPAGG